MPNVKATFTADISQFRRSLAEATTVVTAFDRTTSQVNSALKRFANDFSGAKVQREAEEMAAAIKSIGGAAVLTDANLKRVNGTIKEAIQQYERLGQAAPSSIKSLNAELDTLLAKSKQIDASATPTQATKGFGLLQGAVAGVAAAITSQGLSSIKQFASDIVTAAGDVADLSAKTGLTTTQVQRFGFAAAQTGSSVETITNAVSQLSNRLVEGGTGTVAAVKQLGLSFEGLQRMQPGEAFAQIASAIKAVPDPMQQTQLAMELFGKSGAEILPAIKQGIVELGDEAENLGLIIDSRSVAALDNFGDKWDQMMLRAKASTASVLADTIRIIEEINKVGRAAANALPSEIRNSPIGRTLQSGGPTALGAFGIYGSASRFTNDYLIPLSGDELPSDPGARPLPMGAALGAKNAAEIAFAVKQSDEAIAKLEATLRKSEEAAKQLRQELDKLTGRDVVANATKLATQIEKVGVANVLPRSMPQFVEQLQEGLERARELGPKFAQSARQIETSLAAAVNSPAYREFFRRGLVNPTIGLGDRSNLAAITGASLTTAITGGLPASTIPDLFDTLDAAKRRGSIAGITVDLQKGVRATKDWRIELQGVAQAFAQLSQIAGRSFDGVNRTIGTAIASAQAGMELVRSLAGIFDGLQTADGKQTGKGAALAGGLSGIGIGSALGGVIQSRWGALAAGAAGGAVTGGMATGWNPWGVGVGAVVGGISAVLTSGAMAAAQNKAKDLQLDQLIAQFGTLEELLHVADGLGLDQEGLLKKLWGDPEAFAEGVSELNAALTKERQEVDRLSKSLDAAAKAQGILSRADMAALAALRKGGPGDEMRQQFLEGQTGQLVGGLTSLLQSGTLTPDIVGSAGVALGAAFTLMKQQGLSVKQILESLGPALDAFRERAVNAGLGSTEQFDNLSRMLDVLRGPMGAVIDAAHGAGAALAALANTGMISQDMFGGLAKSITDAYKTLERNGQGGTQAVLMLQGPLQNIWQLMQDFGLQVDDETRGLIDFAEEAGLIGEDFRPATEQMVEALDKLIERMDQFLSLMAQVNGIEWPTPSAPPAPDVPGFVTYPENPFPGGRPTIPGVDLGAGDGEGKIPVDAIDLGALRATPQPVEQRIYVQLDGRTIAEGVARDLPDVYRLMGVA